VDYEKCTGCNQCEAACPVIVTDYGYNIGLGPKKPVGVPFQTAMPQKAVIDIKNCILCGRCANVCPTDAIIFSDTDKIVDLNVHSIVVATGFLETPQIKKEYGAGAFTNVLSGKQMERLLSPTGPCGGVFRPSDSKIPWTIAYVQCAGSRDESIGIPYCSSVCCMYAIKQAMLLSGATPLADITIYYMDLRTFGKGHDEFLEEAKAMGINFVKGKIAKITEDENKDLTLYVDSFDDYDPGFKKEMYDLVVLSLGMVPQWNPRPTIPLELNEYGFVAPSLPKLAPNLTNIPGIVMCGTAMEPKDIVESIVSGSAAAEKVSEWLDERLEIPVEERLPVKIEEEIV
jgi:heterodisulfide reductase subunit A